MKNTLLITLLALAAITAHGQNLLTNGDFETDAVSSGAYTYISDGGNSITGWTLETGDVDLVGESVTMSWAGTTASQCVDLNGLQKGVIEQTFATTIGKDYLISFKYSWNKDGSLESVKNPSAALYAHIPAGTASKSLVVKPMGVRFPNEGNTKTNDAPVSHSAGWTTTNFLYTATQSSHTLRFSGYGNRESGGPLIDDVSVTVVE